MRFLVWVHDPCQEGGWHTLSETDTFEEAVRRAKKIHEEELKRLAEMREDNPSYIGCYDEVAVTPDFVLKLVVPAPPKVETG